MTDNEKVTEYILEGAGTAILVSMACFAFITCGMLTGGIITGLVFFGLVYFMADRCGCHFNPVVTGGMLVSKRMAPKDALWYIVAQLAGGLVGGLILIGVVWAYGTPMNEFTFLYQSRYDDALVGAMITETLLAFTFTLVVLKATGNSGRMDMRNGIAVAVALTGAVLLGSVTCSLINPAKSLGVAIVSLFTGNTHPIIEVWLFLLFPIIGAALAGFANLFISGELSIREFLQSITPAEKEKAEPSDEHDDKVSEKIPEAEPPADAPAEDDEEESENNSHTPL